MWTKETLRKNVEVCKKCEHFHAESKTYGKFYVCDLSPVACDLKEDYENQPVYWLCPHKSELVVKEEGTEE